MSLKIRVLLFLSAVLSLAASCEKDDREIDPADSITINGLKWDKTNTVIDDEEFFNFYDAQDAAESVGKRLPTKAEFIALMDLGSTWDDELKGRWFGPDHAWKGGSVKSLFFPAAGARGMDGLVVDTGKYGVCWSSDSEGFHLAFSDSYVQVAVVVRDDRYEPGYSVRCVRD